MLYLSTTEYQIVLYVHHNRDCTMVDIIRNFSDADFCMETYDLTLNLLDTGFLTSSQDRGKGTLSITPKGVSSLATLADVCQESAKQEKDKVLDRNINIAGQIIVPIIGVILSMIGGAVIEHFMKPVGVVVQWLHSL